ncbi:MAG: putative membrane protein YqiK [Phenylobacterium sp.]|jgi:uncharacterized membrane protein YqiK
MKVLHTFSEKEKSYHLYQARLNYVREQQTLEAEHQKQVRVAEEERALKEKERALKEEERTLKELAEAKAEKAQAEQERLKALLRAQGIDPDLI